MASEGTGAGLREPRLGWSGSSTTPLAICPSHFLFLAPARYRCSSCLFLSPAEEMGASPSGLASCSRQAGPNRPAAGPGFHIWHPSWAEEGDSAGGSAPGPVPTSAPLLCCVPFSSPPHPPPHRAAPRVLACSGPGAWLPYPTSQPQRNRAPAWGHTRASSQVSFLPYSFPLCSPALPHPTRPSFCDQICQTWEELETGCPALLAS